MNTLARWNPIRELEDRFSTLFGRALRTNGGESIPAIDWAPSVDVTEDEKEFLIKAELPEVNKEDVKVTIEDGSLRIVGERKFEKETKEKKYHRIERAYGSFERCFGVPEGTKPESMKAEYKDGVLNVHLPKTEQPKPKAVEVKIS